MLKSDCHEFVIGGKRKLSKAVAFCGKILSGDPANSFVFCPQRTPLDSIRWMQRKSPAPPKQKKQHDHYNQYAHEAAGPEPPPTVAAVATNHYA
jgi:hypothetical protein